MVADKCPVTVLLTLDPNPYHYVLLGTNPPDCCDPSLHHLLITLNGVQSPINAPVTLLVNDDPTTCQSPNPDVLPISFFFSSFTLVCFFAYIYIYLYILLLNFWGADF